MLFEYGEKETRYLKSKDRVFGAVIDRIGHIDREIHTDLFTAIVHSIVAQQISNKALATVWGRIMALVGQMDAEHLLATGDEALQACGISFKKAENIIDFSRKVKSKELDLDAIALMSDEQAVKTLSALKGIGVWTAEMLLLFCLQRPDILSFGDFAIQRGLRMVYHHRKIDRRLFEKYRRRFSPYGSVASLYLWAVAGGAIPEMRDYAPKQKPAKKTAANTRKNASII